MVSVSVLASYVEKAPSGGRCCRVKVGVCMRRASFEVWEYLETVRRFASKGSKSRALVETKKKRVVFDPSRFRQPGETDNAPATFPYVFKDPEEDYYRRRFYPKLKEVSDDEDKEKGLGGWRRRGEEGNYGRSFRESKRSRDAFIARYGVEALKPALKHRPFWETQDPGDLDDEKYFDEKEYAYEPIKPRRREDVPRSMSALVTSLCKFAREGNHFLAADVLDEATDCMKFDQGLWTAMHYACDRGRHQIVKLFLMKDPDVDLQDYDGVTPLMAAANNGHYKVCQSLIQAKANLESKDKSDRTALLLSLAGRHHEVATLLIDSGSNVEARDKDGWNPLHYCCFYGCQEVVASLLNAKASVNLQDFEGNTSLHLSASSGHHEICAMLITAAADVRIKNHEGWTAAHVAVHWAQSRCLAAILQTQEDLEILNKEGETLKDMAIRLDHKKLLKVLETWIPDSEEERGQSGDKQLMISAAEGAVTLDVVTFNVSGRMFVTSKSTLEVIYGSYFWMLLNPQEGVPVLNEANRPGLGPGPGSEIKRVSEMEFELKRDPALFAQILDLLRGLKYSNLKDVQLPEDKYDFGMLLDEAKFYRLSKIVDALKANRRTRQEKSYKNVISESRRKKLVGIAASASLVTDYGQPYVPPSVEVAQGNDQYRQWNPVNDPFAKNLPNLRKPLPRRRKPR